MHGWVGDAIDPQNPFYVQGCGAIETGDTDGDEVPDCVVRALSL